MINNPIVYQIAMVLNFSKSVDFRFALDDPIEMKTIAKIIIEACSIPKKRAYLS